MNASPGSVSRLPSPVRLQARPGSSRCPFCFDDLEAPEWTCPACGTRQHAACANELGTCTTLGCHYARTWRRAPAVLAWEAWPFWLRRRFVLLAALAVGAWGLLFVLVAVWWVGSECLGFLPYLHGMF